MLQNVASIVNSSKATTRTCERKELWQNNKIVAEKNSKCFLTDFEKYMIVLRQFKKCTNNGIADQNNS